MADEVRRVAARVYLIGSDGPLIGAALGDGVAVDRCDTLERAVEHARAAAVRGQTVVLAPACASFDQFADYRARGERFAALARTPRGASCP
jgi:UDP-N-acetylmuramoylalanine--D-glutamate ligase